MRTVRESRLSRAAVRLVDTGNGFAGVVLTNGRVTPPITGKDGDEVWRLLCAEAGKSDPSFIGYDGARARFLRIFRDGFAGTAYAENERNYKADAKNILDTSAPLDAALAGTAMGEAALAAFRKTNLLSPYEKVRLQEALRGPSADAFVRGAARFTKGESAGGLPKWSRR